MSVQQLIHACAESNDDAAWQEFVTRFHRPISLSVLRTSYQWGAAPQQIVDDLVQETYVKLCENKCRLLLEFALTHSEGVHGYIKTIAVNVAHDYFKSLHSQKRGSGLTSQLLEDFDLVAKTDNTGGQDAIERQVLLKQIHRCLEACSEGPDRERDILIFWLYYQQGMSAKAIAGLPTVCLSAKGVESAISRLTRLVREQVIGLQPHSGTDPAGGRKGFRSAESY